jgi:hypothetical protein
VFSFARIEIAFVDIVWKVGLGWSGFVVKRLGNGVESYDCDKVKIL